MYNDELEKKDENCPCDEEMNSEECQCSDSCDCGDNNECGDNRKCEDNRDCGNQCDCDEECNCDENCKCGDDCKCSEDDKCNENCTCGQGKSESEYLDMARRVQADFDNYRRHAFEEIKKAKLDGQASVIEVFLPCLDTFKEAKKNIADENVLKGVEMIENKINEALSSLGVERLDSIGQVYNPHLHNVIAVMRDESKEEDVILDEYQAGYKFKDKVLRYAKVIVNKL